MRRPVAAIAAAALLLGGCSADVDPPGETKVDVDTPALRELKADIGMQGCAEGPGGGSLPELTLPCLGGGTSVDLSTLRGPLVINTWASNCGPCIKEMPALQEFHQKYGEQVPVLGINFLDVMPEAALELARATGATYPSLADPGGRLLEQKGLRLSPGNPQFLLLDEEGGIAHQSAGGLDSVQEIVTMVNDQLGTAL
jgi:thiol-disulfide isomerase/thioredoxin